MGALTDPELWEIVERRRDHDPDIAKLLAHIEALEQDARTIEVVDLARVDLKPGDTLLVRPKECADIANADQAEEWAKYLRAVLEPFHPGVRVLVLPLPSDVAVIDGFGHDA